MPFLEPRDLQPTPLSLTQQPPVRSWHPHPKDLERTLQETAECPWLKHQAPGTRLSHHYQHAPHHAPLDQQNHPRCQAHQCDMTAPQSSKQSNPLQSPLISLSIKDLEEQEPHIHAPQASSLPRFHRQSYRTLWFNQGLRRLGTRVLAV